MKIALISQDVERMKSVQLSEIRPPPGQRWNLILAFLSGCLVTSVVLNAFHYHIYQKVLSQQAENETDDVVNQIPHFIKFSERREADIPLDSINPMIDRISAVIRKSIGFKNRVLDSSCALPEDHKFDCDPNPNTTQSQCLSLGCCWVSSVKSPGSHVGKPVCFFPSNYVGYEITNKNKTDKGLQLELTRRSSSSFDDVEKLSVSIVEVDTNTLQVKIGKENGSEPLALPGRLNLPPRTGQKKDGNQTYTYSIDNGILTIHRKVTGLMIWSANLQTLIFAKQFRQLDTQVPVPALYGLGEHMDHLRKTDFNFTRYTFSNRGRDPTWMLNSYGTHPMYLIQEPKFGAHFALHLNTYPGEAILRPGPGITWRTIGGDFEFTFHLQDSTLNVIASYTKMVGLPFLPPVWSLGFHLSRFGYDSLNETRATYQRMRDAQIPYDTQWHDIDAMDTFNDFTYDPINFHGLPDFVQELHNNGMQYVPIVDPGLDGIYLNGSKYPGFNLSAVVRNPDGSALRAQVWNQNWTVWIDFTSQAGQQLWSNQIASYHGQVHFDGIWIDMNEPTNLVNGSLDGCLNSTLDHPPYIPGDELDPIYEQTACMSAQHAVGAHYRVHNTYGHWEAWTTYLALEKLQMRPFILSRSSFVGTGAYSGHWTGDIQSTWEYMKQSIVGVLEFNLFGIPMTGADICGFHGNTTVELCARWHQLGAFYPFSRNHNDKGAIAQDPPSLGPTVVRAAKNALQLRYRLHNVLYSSFFAASIVGMPVAWPLMMFAPDDQVACTIETQFMWQNQLMIIPVLEPNATTVNAYFPAGIWYDFPSLATLVSNQTGSWLKLDAPLDTIRLAVPGGSVLVLQKPEVTIAQTRQNPLEIVAFLDEDQQAYGYLYWDDGKSVQSENKANSVIYFLSGNVFVITPFVVLCDSQPITSTISIVGMPAQPESVYLNDQLVSYEWQNNVLMVTVNQTWDTSYTISWNF